MIMPRPVSRRTTAVTVAAGALTAALGAAGMVGALTVQPHPASRAAVATARPSTVKPASPYFVCLAYQQVWGICIGPPTN